MAPIDLEALKRVPWRPGEQLVETSQGQDGSILALTNQRLVVLIPKGLFSTSYDPSTSYEIGRRTGESIVNSWIGSCDSPIVLTTERLMILGWAQHGSSLVSRDLDSISEPRVEFLGSDSSGPNFVLHVAGRSIGFYGDQARAARDEIAYARERRLGLHPGANSNGSSRPVSVVKEREVIREVVRIPCRHCGILVDNTATKCPSCGAPRN
jgi:hypothetical protein